MKKIILLLLICMLTFLTACSGGKGYSKYDEETINDIFQDKEDHDIKMLDDDNINIYKNSEMAIFKDGKKFYVGMSKKEVEAILGKPENDGFIITYGDKDVYHVDYNFSDKTEVTYESCSEDHKNRKDETLIGVVAYSPEYEDCLGIKVGTSREEVDRLLVERYGEDYIKMFDSIKIYKLNVAIDGSIKHKDETTYSLGEIRYYFSDDVVETIQLFAYTN